VTKLLAAKQHTVVAPALTGLGERSHLLNPEIDLDTHILDVVNVIKRQELRDVVLVGHSYGGMVISGVAERMEKSIASIVMLDAFCPADGQRAIDLLPPPVREAILKRARDGATTTPPPPAATANAIKPIRRGLTPNARSIRSSAFYSLQWWPALATGAPKKLTSAQPIFPARRSTPACRKPAAGVGAQLRSPPDTS
jgi:pimeloyl-ACP methyl ester carboxylesterase